MLAARFGNTATLLADGRVLIVGGADRTGAHEENLASAELYDPATGKSSPTGSMAQARLMHTATLLADGRVLLAGGLPDGSNPKNTTLEIYDPAKGTFVSVGSVPDTFTIFQAVGLLDGRVLLLGSNGTSATDTVGGAELYDPVTGILSPIAAMPYPNSYYTVTRLPDGRVLAAGGKSWTVKNQVVSEKYLASAELYDPVTGKWTTTGSMQQARAGAVATLLADGRVLVVGGCAFDNDANEKNPFASAEIYDPKTGRFSTTGSMARDRGAYADASVTLLLDGRVLVAGGDPNSGSDTSAELYDPKTGTFSKAGSFTPGRYHQTATLLADGRVLLAGGLTGSGAVSLSSLVVYQP